MTDYGKDFDVRSDFNESLSTTTGLQIVKNACLHRLTQRSVIGRSDAHVNFGIDLREKLGARETDLASECDDAVQRDPRVLDSEHTVTRIVGDGDKVSLRIGQQVSTSFGPFERVLSVTALTVEILGEP